MGAFDDDMKKRAGDFRLEPREAVWERIEQELETKKRRRPIFWLWWLIPLALAGGGVVFFNQSTPTDHTMVQSNPHLGQQPSRQKELQGKNTAESSPVAKNNFLQDTLHTHTTTKSIAFTGKATPAKESLPESLDIEMVEIIGATSGKREAGQNEFEQEEKVMLPGLRLANEENFETEDFYHPAKAMLLSLTFEDYNKVQHHYTAEIHAERYKRISPSAELNENSNQSAQKQDLKKANWTIVGGAGLHNMTASGFGLEKSMADYNSGIPQNSTGGGFNNASTQLVPTEPGAGIMLGIERSQSFGQSKRWVWMAGLHYQYQSMQIFTGPRKDSSISLRSDAGGETKSASYFYRGGRSVEHTGSQHRAHILATVQLYLGKKQKWSWQNGFYGGMVLSNDYLLPQSSVTGWVPSKGLVNTGYFGLETGIKFQPGKIGGGIFGQYNLTSSVSASSLPKQYWRGIECRIHYQLSSPHHKK